MQDVFEDNDRVYLIMELMNGGELFDRICNDFPNGYSEKQSSVLIKKIIEAVKYLHDKVSSLFCAWSPSILNRGLCFVVSPELLCGVHRGSQGAASSLRCNRGSFIEI